MTADRFYNLLYTFNNHFPGQVVLLPKGVVMLNKLKKIIKSIYKKYGALEINTPTFGTCDLWHKTKHVFKYEDNMYNIENKYYLKPMNCPMHVETMKIIYSTKSIIPISVFEFNYCFRKEKSGSIHSLFRLLRFTQDDSHILCKINQVDQFIIDFINIIKEVYSLLEITNIKFRLSNTDQEYIGNHEQKDLSYNIIRNVLDSQNIQYYITDDGAFYGPKIDVIILDQENREWQTGTIQLDFCLLKNLDFHFQNTDNINECLILHRAILGTFERFIGLLLHNNLIPRVINPYRLAIINLNSIIENKIIHLRQCIIDLEISDVDIINANINEINQKIKQIYQVKYNMYCVIGEKEVNNNKIIVHNIHMQNSVEYTIDELINIINYAKY